MTAPIKLTPSSKSHYFIAGEMAEEIKAIIYKHADQIPLVLALGVLRIVESEIIEEQA